MPESDAERWEDLLAAEVLREIQGIPIEERRKRLLPAFVYARELAAEHPAAGDANGPERAREVVHEHAAPKLFRDMFDPKQPLCSGWVLNQATRIAWEQLRKKQHLFRRYCVDLPRPTDSLGYAFDGLMALGERMCDRALEEVRDPYRFLWRTIWDSLGRDIDLNIRKHRDPGSRKHYALVLKFRKQLELADPSKDKDEIEEEAVGLADEALQRLVQLLYRVDFEQAEALAGEIDFSELVHSKLMLDLMEELLQKGPFTDVDRDTWARWRAVEFVGRDIDWEAAGVKSSTGAQRLHALVRKLRGPLSDLGYGA
jgi:hypothetical protein